MARTKKKSEPSSDTFAKRLTLLMEQRKMTVRKAATLAGVSTSTLQDWKTGIQPTNFIAVRSLAIALGTTLSFLLTGEDDSRPNGDISVTEVFKDGGEVFDGYLKVKIERMIPRFRND